MFGDVDGFIGVNYSRLRKHICRLKWRRILYVACGKIKALCESLHYE